MFVKFDALLDGVCVGIDLVEDVPAHNSLDIVILANSHRIHDS